jgi:hypothetical protein
MMSNRKSKAYVLSLQLYTRMCETGQMRKITLEQYSEKKYERVETGLTTKFQPEELTILDTNLFKREWSAGAIKLMTRIMAELMMNNALWHFESSNSRERKVIAELRTHGILLKTEDSHIHYVNPDKIRRGGKPAVLALTTKELETVSRVSKDNIRNLGHAKEQIFSLFDQAVKQLE